MIKKQYNITRILFCEAGAHGGSVKRLINTLQSLDRRKFAPSVFTYFKNGKAKDLLKCDSLINSDTMGLTTYPAEDVLKQVGHISIPTRFAFKYFAKSLKIIIRDSPDLVYLNNTPFCHLPMIMAAKIFGKPIICHMRDSVNLTRSEFLALKMVNRIIVLSETHKRFYFDQIIPNNKISVVYNSIDLEDFDRAARESNIRLEKNGIHIAFVGVLTDRKRQKDAIEALRHIRKKFPNIKLLFIGDGPDDKKLRGLSRKYDLDENIQFVGMIKNVAPYLKSCNIGLMLSSREGMPNVILEYMAAGLPVIATDISGVSEMVIDGVNGYTIPAGDINELVIKLIDLLSDNDKMKKFGTAARSILEAGGFSTLSEMSGIEKAMYTVLKH